MTDTDSPKSPYEILEVTEDVHYVKLRHIYRDIIHQHKQGKISANDFRLKVRAYETLSDFDKRKKYDSPCKQWIHTLPVGQYTAQQLAAEPSLLLQLEFRLKTATLSQINAQDPATGHTALYCAARAGNIQGVKFLTRNGAEADLSQRTASTALHVASFYGHPDVVQYLLETGADYRIKNSEKSTAEDEAYNDAVKQVFTRMKTMPYVRAAANEIDWFLNNTLLEHIDEQYFMQRQTLLHCASKKGYLELVKVLVEKFSAQLDILDVNFNSALHLAAYGGHDDVVKYLLDQGCDPRGKNRWGTTAEQEGTKYAETILYHFNMIRNRDPYEMARQGILWWFEYYMGDSAINRFDSDGVSLLYYSCAFGHTELATWLLIHGANINDQMEKPPRSTALHVAKYCGHSSIIELLIEYGANATIKNDFGFTVFEEVFQDTADENSKQRIKALLRLYQNRQPTSKVIDIYLYSDDGRSENPVEKVQINIRATYKDLVKQLPDDLQTDVVQFSIARRPLKFPTEETTVLAAIRAARHIKSWFFETPICLTMHKKDNQTCHKNSLVHGEPYINSRALQKNLQKDSNTTDWFLAASSLDAYKIQINQLTFTLPKGSVKNDITLMIKTSFSVDLSILDVKQCICAFEIRADDEKKDITEMPSVSIMNHPDALLYSLATGTSYLFRSKTKRNRIPMFNGTHIFLNPIIVIPSKLSLPTDAAIAASFDRLLTKRSEPIPCLALEIQPNMNDKLFDRAYHGTNIDAVQSILMDGFVIPGTIVSSGKRIQAPKYHIARSVKVFGHEDFAGAVFLSPSARYSSDGTYARPFAYHDQLLIPVLECSVKKKCYTMNRCTVSTYIQQPDDDLNTIEWRVEDPTDINIHAILFIPEIPSLNDSTYKRLARTC